MASLLSMYLVMNTDKLWRNTFFASFLALVTALLPGSGHQSGGERIRISGTERS
jgi:hypothetical protein